MPWHAITLTGSGLVKPCCQFRGEAENVHLNPETSIVNLYNSKAIQDVREDFFVKDPTPGCSSCWEREEQIGHSRRIWFEDHFLEDLPHNFDYELKVENPQWIQADINLSNQCNLKCRMCGVWASHKWISDEETLFNMHQGNPYLREGLKEKRAKFEVSLERLASLIPHLANVRRIDFKGGEPMLAKNHIPFLEMLIDKGLNRQATLHYTTNGTFINNNIIEVLGQFKKVNISISIEGTDPLYSYIRGGPEFNTEDLRKNISKYKELKNVDIMFNVAMQAYNLINLKELHGLLKSLNSDKINSSGAFNCVVNAPDYLSPFVWPVELRKKIADELEQIDDFKHFSGQLKVFDFDQNLFNTFINFTRDLDKIRNEDYFGIYPELKKYI